MYSFILQIMINSLLWAQELPRRVSVRGNIALWFWGEEKYHTRFIYEAQASMQYIQICSFFLLSMKEGQND